MRRSLVRQRRAAFWTLRERARREQRAIERFIARFRARWLSQTRCAEGYIVEECGASTI